MSYSNRVMVNLLNPLKHNFWQNASLKSEDSRGVVLELFREIYSFVLVGDIKDISLTRLHMCGLVVNCHGKYELVYEEKFIQECLVQTARLEHELFASFDIGGAKELQFSDLCHRGPITAKCLGGTPLTIRGKTLKSNTLTISCTHFFRQPTIGAQVQVPPIGCCLVKLALLHPAIDFIIFESQGSQASKILYFVQVSAQRYQERTKKLEDVLATCPELSGESPYDFYKKMFGLSQNSCEIYYIYSSLCPIPMDKTFSRKNREQDCIYFHQLRL